jgi:hypothetical protein
MKHFVLLVLACLTFGMPRTALSESYEARKTKLNKARDAYHALMDQLPFNALRLDFASVGSAAFTAAEVEVVAMAPWQEESRYLIPWQGFDLVALYDNPQAMADTYVGALMANYGEFLSSNPIKLDRPLMSAYTPDRRVGKAVSKCATRTKNQ